jgi:prolyl-tRNA editing enzyme YbaK/EbsC (Cys-tRNA(Pro) deacylase)
MRLVPEEINTKLTGFEHNAVAPIGCRMKIPIIVSHRIAELQPSFFWLGGGEVDLKLGLDWNEFSQIYSPYAADCTYD